MRKNILMALGLAVLLGSCSSTPNAPATNVDRVVASSDGREGTYLSKEIRNNDGQIGILREFDLMRNYSGRNIKGILIEVLPFNSYSNRARLDVSLNGRTIENHDIMVRAGRQHLFTDINMEVRDEVRELSLRYDPRQVNVQSITVLISEDRPWDNHAGGPGGPDFPGGGPGFPGNPGQDRDSYSQDFDRISRGRGGSYYDLNVPRFINAQYLKVEALNSSVLLHNITSGNQAILIPGGNGSRLVPGYPVQIMLPNFGRIDNLRFQAEGMQREDVGLRVTVSSRPFDDNRPGPGPGPFPGPGRPDRPEPRPDPRPMPPRIVSETCVINRFDPSGVLIQGYPSTASGPFGTDVMGEACRTAKFDCSRDLKGRQTCR